MLHVHFYNHHIRPQASRFLEILELGLLSLIENLSINFAVNNCNWRLRVGSSYFDISDVSLL